MKNFLNWDRNAWLVLFLLPSVGYALGDTIDEGVRHMYLPTVNAMCHSSTEYTLDMPFEVLKGTEGVKDKYNKKMECLFESAFVKATNDMNTDFRNDFFSKIFDPKDPYEPEDRSMKTSDCDGMKIDEIFQKQRKNGYETLCKIDGRTSTVETLYSSCRVAEVAWNEFCAYQEYLIWKQRDGTVYSEFMQRGNVTGQEAFTNYLALEQEKQEKEIADSYRVLWETLEQYHSFMQNYRIDLWENVIIEALKVTQEKYILIRTAIETWSRKFHNASAL